MTDSKTMPTWAKALGLAVFILAGIFAVLNDGDGNGAPAAEQGVPESVAWGNCKEAVKAQLNHPATADFSILSTTIKQHGAVYDIAGSLTAENGFGVESEIGFTCLVQEDGATSADLS